MHLTFCVFDVCHRVSSLFKTVKNARGGRSKLKQTLKRLGNDAATKDVLEAARELSEKATVRFPNYFQIIFNF